MFANGVDLTTVQKKLRHHGISQLGIKLMEGGLILLSADIETKKLLFGENTQNLVRFN